MFEDRYLLDVQVEELIQFCDLSSPFNMHDDVMIVDAYRLAPVDYQLISKYMFAEGMIVGRSYQRIKHSWLDVPVERETYGNRLVPAVASRLHIEPLEMADNDPDSIIRQILDVMLTALPPFHIEGPLDKEKPISLSTYGRCLLPLEEGRAYLAKKSPTMGAAYRKNSTQASLF
jgi:hypothetical protein